MRRAREWPRLIVLAAVLAALLVLIGVVVASAAGGSGSGSGGSGSGGKSSTVATSAPVLKAPKADQAMLKSQQSTITRLRTTLATKDAQIATLQQQLKREHALRRVRVHARVKHHKKHHAK